MKKIICLSFVVIGLVLCGFNSKANAEHGQIGTIYSNINSCVPDSCDLGNSTKVKSAIAKTKSVLTLKPTIGKKYYTNITDKLYVLYKYDKYVNSSIYDFGTTISIAPNTTYEKSFEMSETKTINCEETVQNELKVDYSIAMNAGVELFEAVQLGVSTDTSIEAKISSTTKTNHTVSYTRGEKETFTIVNDTNKVKNYWLQLRASFECYVVQVYEVLYNVSTKTEGKFLNKTTSYIYSSCGFKLVEQYTSLKLVPRSLSKGYFEMKLNNKGQYVCAEQFDNAINLN